MRVNNIILALIVVSVTQLAFARDTCPFAYAKDGTVYDLSDIADKTFKLSEPDFGQTYNYNISICSPSPYPCSGSCFSPNSAGVCLFWGPAPNGAKCFGSANTRQVTGLIGGVGVQISYQGGDTCGSCNPSGPRSSVITLLCDDSVPVGRINWNYGGGAQPGQPPVMYFNGTMRCSTNSPPNSCKNLYAPDGSYYNLSPFTGRDYEWYTYDKYTQSYVLYNFAVCGGIKVPCGNGVCSTSSAGASCQQYEAPASAEKCFGQTNMNTLVQPLNFGQGVVITYYDGDNCLSCYRAGPRQTILQLTCDYYASPSTLEVTSVYNPPESTVLYINATIGCIRSSSPQPSYSPHSPYTPYSSAPSGYNPNKHVTIQYYSYSSCSDSDVFMVTVNRTNYCYPGCSKQGTKYILTVCDDNLYLPQGSSWVEQTFYGSNSCDSVQSALYMRSHMCTGNFQFGYQDCDSNAVYTYDCTSPYCNHCDLVGKNQTQICNNGSMYKCVTDNSNACHNPLL